MKSRIIGVIAGVAVLLGVGVVATAAVKPDCKNLMYPLCPRSVAATQVVDNSLPKSKIVPADRDAFLKDTNTPDVKGDAQFVKPLPAKVIENLGGPYFGATTATDDDRYTKIGEIVVPAGSWMVYTSVQFTRTAAGVAGSRPQVGLRIGQDQTKSDDSKWGVSVGTVGGNDIAPFKGADLFGETHEPLVTTENTTVGVYGFGYNDDRGTAGSGEIAASVKITLVRA
jgi:hypothetical protein